MEQTNKNKLAEKLKETEFKLYANEYVYKKISYHWLDILNSIKCAGIKCEIISLCSVSKEQYPYFAAAIDKLNRSDLTRELITIDDHSKMDKMFEKYPSIDSFKYVMDLPLLSSRGLEFNEIITDSKQLPEFDEEPVYFISPDWSPTIRLSWKEVIEKGDEAFSNIPLAYVFSNSTFSKILFKSIENEWRIRK